MHLYHLLVYMSFCITLTHQHPRFKRSTKCTSNAICACYEHLYTIDCSDIKSLPSFSDHEYFSTTDLFITDSTQFDISSFTRTRDLWTNLQYIFLGGKKCIFKTIRVLGGQIFFLNALQSSCNQVLFKCACVLRFTISYLTFIILQQRYLFIQINKYVSAPKNFSDSNTFFLSLYLPR